MWILAIWATWDKYVGDVADWGDRTLVMLAIWGSDVDEFCGLGLFFLIFVMLAIRDQDFYDFGDSGLILS